MSKDKETKRIDCPYCKSLLKEISLLMTDYGAVSDKPKKGYECIKCKAVFPIFAKRDSAPPDN